MTHIATRFRKSRSQGFSLVEMLVVVTIIGLMAGVSVPAFLNFLKAFRLRTAGRQVLGDMHLARQRAITKSRDVYVFFPAGENTYDIVESDRQKGIPLTGFNVVFSSRVFKKDVRIGEHLVLVADTASRPAGSTETGFPARSLSPVEDSTGLATEDYSSVPAAIFRADGTVETAGAVWVALEPGDRGPRFTWMEISANAVGRVSTRNGP